MAQIVGIDKYLCTGALIYMHEGLSLSLVRK
ncbi:hypothetical protein ICA_02142 [Bacillus cereus BAG1O-3]|nr:hypothetical protein ICA_02142 [Bacillus cereus BAG1O-3]MCP1398753.1 D-alanyl-D-alanine carboxypeptidase [Bacillus cereus]